MSVSKCKELRRIIAMSLHILLYEAGGFPVSSDEADANPVYCASIKYYDKEIFRSPVAANKKWNNRSIHPLEEIFDSKGKNLLFCCLLVALTHLLCKNVKNSVHSAMNAFILIFLSINGM